MCTSHGGSKREFCRRRAPLRLRTGGAESRCVAALCSCAEVEATLAEGTAYNPAKEATDTVIENGEKSLADRCHIISHTATGGQQAKWSGV